MDSKIVFRVNGVIQSDLLDALFTASWPSHSETNWSNILSRSLCYICAFSDDNLIGFVNVAWDGGVHAFLLDTTVHPEFRRQGIGIDLIKRATAYTKNNSIEWLHVDFEPQYRDFYHRCGFKPTAAGLIKLTEFL